jgi:hypothetical protein
MAILQKVGRALRFDEFDAEHKKTMSESVS